MYLFKKDLFYSICAFLLVWEVQEITADCSDDYSPCVCIFFDNRETQIYCHYVPAKEVQLVFNRTKTQLVDSVSLTLNSSDMGKVPANLLSGKAAKRISLFEDGYGDYDQLVIDADAFTSSSGHTLRFEISLFDVGNLDWGFLREFVNLDALSCGYCDKLYSIQSLPNLLNLTTMRIDFARGLNEITSFPRFSRLKFFQLSNSLITDDTLDLILDSLANSTSAETMETLQLFANRGVSRFPKIGLFTNLTTLEVDNNPYGSLTNGSVTIDSAELQKLSLTHTSLYNIEPGAFNGVFRFANVNLAYNFLTDFTADVFRPMLLQMAESKLGFLQVESNNFRCDCSISWLILESRNLLDRIENGVCSNGIEFQSLDSGRFSECNSSRHNLQAVHYIFIFFMVFLHTCSS